MKDEKYRQVRDHCHYTGKYRGSAHKICNLKHSVPKKIQQFFIMHLTFHYHFIVKKLTWGFKRRFTCSGENSEKCIILTAPLEEGITKTDKTVEESKDIYILYILQFINSARFRASSLSNLVYNLSEGIRRIEFKLRHQDKKCETCGIKYKYSNCFSFFQ